MGDVNDDGRVDVTDLLHLVARWGWCDACREDLDADVDVDGADLLVVVRAWAAGGLSTRTGR